MNLSLLRFYMSENSDTVVSLAKALGMHYTTLAAKLSGKREFTQSEIKAIAKRYRLSAELIKKIFL